MWDLQPGSEKNEETNVSAEWDTGINISQEFKQLFGEFDFEEF